MKSVESNSIAVYTEESTCRIRYIFIPLTHAACGCLDRITLPTGNLLI
ncbi:MAG: hypothetical protein LBM19_04495 [Holosporales bacterium]|nr:hypothetical protein [Holosporales bacterium]